MSDKIDRPRPSRPPAPKPLATRAPAKAASVVAKKDEMSTGRGSALRSKAAKVVGSPATSSAVGTKEGTFKASSLQLGKSPPAGLSATGAAGTSAGTAQGPTTATPPGPVDPSPMTPVDNAIVSALGVDKMVPGTTYTVTVKASGELAAGLGVEVGADVTVTVERSKDDPDKLTFSMGAGGEVGGKATADSAGAGQANATGALTGEAKLEFSVDLSKPGEATKLAVFAANTGVMTGVATAVGAVPGASLAAVAALNGLESAFGVQTPLAFVASHLTAVEGSVGGKLTALLAGQVGPALSGQLDGYLKGGGRVEFNPDGTLTLKGNVTVGADGSLKGGAGVAGQVATTLGTGTAEVSFQASTRLNPGPPMTVVSQGYSATFTLKGGAAVAPGVTAGGSVALSVSVNDLPPALRGRVQAALLAGDPQAAAALLSQALQSGSVKASVDVTGSTTLDGEVKLVAEELGTGGGAAVSGSISAKVPLLSGKVTVTATGVKLDAALFGYPAGTELSWAQLQALSEHAAP